MKRIITLSALCAGLALPGCRLASSEAPVPPQAFAHLAKRSASGPLANRFGHAAAVHPAPVAPTADSLEATDWYATVAAALDRASYGMAAGTDGTASSTNVQNRLQTRYRADGFSLSPLEECEAPGPGAKQSSRKNEKAWNLDLRVRGLYADGTLACVPAAGTSGTLQGSQADFCSPGGLTVQYQNTAAGVRQNFIVAHEPHPGVRELRVALQASAGWVVDKAGEGEMHFAKRTARGGLHTEVVYKDLKAWDAGGKTLAAHFQEGRDGALALVVDAAGARYPVTIDPLSTTAASTLAGPSSGSNFGRSVACAGDVNGDGYNDVIVGAPGTTTGNAYLYQGSGTGLSTTPSATLAGPSSGSVFGFSVASAGDVNGDGYSDVIVGAYGVSSSTGAAYVYLGSASGLSATAASTFSGPSTGSYFGIRVAGAGDVNGDGYSDVLIGAPYTTTGTAYVYQGSAAGLSATASTTLTGASAGISFGYGVAAAGDVNGDGYSDVLVGAYASTSNTGAAYAYHGSPSGLSATAATTFTGPSAGSYFGFSLASAGDVNGDGYSDAVIGAYGTTTGNAYAYLGSASGLSATAATTFAGPSNSSNFGYSVASAGDVNGDGYGDLVVGAYATTAGSAYVYQGSATGLPATATTTLAGPSSGSNFGYSVACAGDINGDGFSDVVVGAGNTTLGNAYLYQGASASTMLTAATSLTAAGSGSFGYSAASAGDVNGDGYSDVIIGVNSSSGAAYLYLGSATGLATSAATTLTGTSNSYFGYSVASAGDVNGDGYSDVVIGARGTNKAYVYLGSGAGLSGTAATTLTGPVSGSNFGVSVASAGDVNGDGYSDVVVGANAMSYGYAYIYLGSASGLSATAATTLTGPYSSSYFGFSVAPAGDVNGDGYGDVIIGVFNGNAYLYLGASTGLAATAATTFTAPSGSSSFGQSVASAGDVNGDGYGDVLVGAYATTTATIHGTAYVYLGSASGVSNTVATTLSTNFNVRAFGQGLASAGDVNGDGYSDVLIGAPGNGSYNGTTFVFLGSASGLSATFSAMLYPPTSTSGDYFGYSVACAGDVNGDGYSDAVVGAYGASGGGAAFMYPGNGGYGKRSNSLRLYETDLATPLKQTNRSATQVGVGLFVRPAASATKARLVWETEKNRVGFQASGTITNYTGYTAAQAGYTTIPAAGMELKQLVAKTTGSATKLRVRVQYQSATAPNGQTFGPWIYPQAYLTGAMGSGVLYGLAGQPLPLKIAAFDAAAAGSANRIEWRSAAEEPGTRFDVERSADGTAFTTLGEGATGRGDGSAYTVYDAAPLVPVSYYRLKAEDASGETAYSTTVAVRRRSTGGGIVTAAPLPAAGTLTVTNTDAALNETAARIYDGSGRMVYQFVLRAENAIDVSPWPAGLYLLKLDDGQVLHIVKR